MSPHDFVTQAVKVAMERKDLAFCDEPRILAQNNPYFSRFGALSSNALVGANLLLDILTTSPEQNVYETLREEAARAFPSEAEWSDPAALRKLVFTDSAIGESPRTIPITTFGLLREVMPESGLGLPDGNTVSRGTWIGVPVQAVHMDDRFYDHPEQYDPFRFARMVSENDRMDAAQTGENIPEVGSRSFCLVGAMHLPCC